jgi:Spy/CpxP family protein refolding chaperone
MKRTLLLILLAAGLHTLAPAQTPDTTLQPGLKKPDPVKRAARQLRMLEKQLHLTQDQVLQVQVILITETVALDSIRNNPAGNPRTDNRARREVLQDADRQITALLTDEQKPLYQQWKAQQRQRMMQRRQNNNQDNSPYNSQ